MKKNSLSIYLAGIITLGLCFNVSAMNPLTDEQNTNDTANTHTTKKSPLIENDDQATAIQLPPMANDSTPIKTPQPLDKNTMLTTLKEAIQSDNYESKDKVRDLLKTLMQFNRMPNFNAAFDIEREDDKNLFFLTIEKKQYGIQNLLLKFYLDFQHMFFWKGGFLDHETVHREGRVKALLQTLFRKLLDLDGDWDNDFAKNILHYIKKFVNQDQNKSEKRKIVLLDTIYQKLFDLNKDRTQPHIKLTDFAHNDLIDFIKNGIVKENQQLKDYLNKKDHELIDYLSYKAEKLKLNAEKELKEYYKSRSK